MHLFSKYFKRISFFLFACCCFASDEENYHELGRDYVICKWNIEIPGLRNLCLDDRVLLHEGSQEACQRWRSQDRVSVLKPRVEEAHERAKEALNAWCWHALDYFSQVKNISQASLKIIHEIQDTLPTETPVVNPKMSFESGISNYYDTIILFGGLFLWSKIQPLKQWARKCSRT